jgi:transcription elongation factor Elf1
MFLPKITCICGDIVVKSTIDGTSKIRSKILLLKNNTAYAVCKGCGTEVKVPIKVSSDAVSPPLFIKSK